MAVTSLRKAFECAWGTPSGGSALTLLFGHMEPETYPYQLGGKLVPIFPVVQTTYSDTGVPQDGMPAVLDVALSLRRQMELLGSRRIALLLRPVPAVVFTKEDWRRMNGGLHIMRQVYAQIDVGIGFVQWFPVVELSGLEFDPMADKNLDLVELAHSYNITYLHAINLYFVTNIVGATNGISGGKRACPSWNSINPTECAAAAAAGAYAGATVGAVVGGLVGAVIGGIMFGPAGAIAGAASGAAFGAKVGAGVGAAAGLLYCYLNAHACAVRVRRDDEGTDLRGDLFPGAGMAHEVGHYLGLSFDPAEIAKNKDSHTSDPANIMYPDTPGWWNSATQLPVMNFTPKQEEQALTSQCTVFPCP